MVGSPALRGGAVGGDVDAECQAAYHRYGLRHFPGEFLNEALHEIDAIGGGMARTHHRNGDGRVEVGATEAEEHQGRVVAV